MSSPDDEMITLGMMRTSIIIHHLESIGYKVVSQSDYVKLSWSRVKGTLKRDPDNYDIGITAFQGEAMDKIKTQLTKEHFIWREHTQGVEVPVTVEQGILRILK